MANKSSEELVQVLIDWGVKNIYGLPGDSIDTTVSALQEKQDQIKFIQVRHEEVGALAAAAEAKLTGKLGVCLSIGGPGAIHMLNGLYDAKMDHAPVLALLGQVTTNDLNEGYFQEINTPKLFDDVAVFNRTITSPDNLAEVLDEAIRSAYEHRGVAVLTIPDNLPDEKAAPYQSSAKSFHLNAPAVTDEQLQQAADLIKASAKPIALVGVGARNAGPAVTKFLETNHIPFISSMPAKGIIGDAHPNSLGNVGKLGTKPAYEAMKSADLLLLFGTNYPYKPYLPKPGTAKCIQIDLNPENISRRYPVDVAIQSDLGLVITALNKQGELRQDKRFLSACQKSMANWNKWMTAKTQIDDTPIAPEALASAIDKTAPDDLIYSIDVGTSTTWGARFIHAKPTQRYVISAWLGTMGCGLPGAIAAQQAYPDRRALTMCGDGAFAMVMQDFVTAVKYHLPIICVVLNNQKLAFIEYEQQAAGQLNYEINLADIDFAKFAESCGGVGYNVKNITEFKKALAAAYQEKNKPVLINAYVRDDAPLPGKIVGDEAKGYMKYGEEYLTSYWKIPELPPLKDIMRQFF